MDKVSIITNIRKVIFEILKQNEMVDPSVTIDKMEIYFKELCDAEILRNIGQNLNTQWFKLFESIEKIQCNSCKKESYLVSSENRICQNPSCGSTF